MELALGFGLWIGVLGGLALIASLVFEIVKLIRSESEFKPSQELTSYYRALGRTVTAPTKTRGDWRGVQPLHSELADGVTIDGVSASSYLEEMMEW